jgi:hypothetical protein
MKNARLDQVLRLILGRIVTNSGATFVLRQDAIEITTGAYRVAEVWGNGPPPFLPLVHRTFDKVPLDQALRDLSDRADYCVVLDARVGEKGKAPVTARFLNAPLDTAVRLLADMSGLRSVQMDNVLYVTTKENAAAWEARLRKEQGLDEPGGEPTIVGTPAQAPRRGSGRGTTRIDPP